MRRAKIERRRRGRVAVRAPKTAHRHHVQHDRADAVAHDALRAELRRQRHDMFEQRPPQSALAIGRAHAQAKIELARAQRNMRQGDDFAV